jgi:hypothetical protein
MAQQSAGTWSARWAQLRGFHPQLTCLSAVTAQFQTERLDGACIGMAHDPSAPALSRSWIEREFSAGG